MPATLPELDPILEEYIPPPKSRGLLRRFLGMRFLVISIGVHLLLGLVAAVWVVQSYSANRKLTFKGGPPSPNKSTRAIEHKVQMAKKQNTMSAPANKRIVSTGLSKVTLPEMPAMPKTATAPSKMAGVGGANVGAAGGPMGAATSAAGGGLVSLFGLREASSSALKGTFYDLKQDASGKPTSMASPDEKKDNQEFAAAVSSFVGSGFSESGVARFFKGPDPLYTSQIFIPKIPANDGPRAFKVEAKVQPKRWLALYRGRVSPAESGKYRFVGAGDDVLVVKFNGTIVLDAGFLNASGKKPQSQYDLGAPNRQTLGVGDIIEVNASSSYPMEVLIGEQPGVDFGAWLLLEKDGVEYEKSPKGSPKLPIFKLVKSDVPDAGKNGPAFAPDTSWSIWRGEAPKGGLLDRK